MPRLFAALPVDAEAAAALAPVHALLAPFSALLKTVAPQAYHITLKFFGECDEKTAGALSSEFDRFRPGCSALPYAFCGLGAFPNARTASVIWCGLRTDRAAISSLAEGIEEIAGRNGCAREERDFTPHLTLARVRRGRRAPAALADCLERHARTEFGSGVFSRVVLYSSRLRPEGPVYTPLRIITLPERRIF